MPFVADRSLWQTPHADTWIITSPVRGDSTSISSTTTGWLRSRQRTAFALRVMHAPDTGRGRITRGPVVGRPSRTRASAPALRERGRAVPHRWHRPWKRRDGSCRRTLASSTALPSSFRRSAYAMPSSRSGSHSPTMTSAGGNRDRSGQMSGAIAKILSGLRRRAGSGCETTESSCA